MKVHAENILNSLKEIGLEVRSPELEKEMIHIIAENLNEIDILEEAIKREILHVSSIEEMNITEEDATKITELMVHDRDWSHFNEWISQEIDDYLNQK